MTGRAALLAAALTAALSGPAGPSPARAEKPERIVSLNLCTDQLLLLLAERARIVSISFLGADPASSAMVAEARGLPLNHGKAEEVLPLRPDLVLAGTMAARPTVALLRRLGHRVVEVPLARGLGDVPAHIRLVARALGEEERGEALIARFRARRATLEGQPREGPRPVAVLRHPNGLTSGAETLPGAALRAAGFANLAARRGIEGVGRIPLEILITAAPDVLILGRLGDEAPSLAARSVQHPALKRAFSARPTVAVPHRLWACATPHVLDAVARLTELRRRMVGDAGERRP